MAQQPANRDRPVVTTTAEALPAVSAATVLLLRDGSAGPEVFMLERHLKSDFIGGAYVFPGGKVDGFDRSLSASMWTGIDLPATGARMRQTEAEALGSHVAAVRETFEESGILLGSRAGRPLVAADLLAPSFQVARERLCSRDDDWDWRPWLREERLVLDLGQLAWWSWWVTPAGVHRRFDTRFFVAVMPGDQVAAHDRVETTNSRWVTPEEALQAASSGQVQIIFPTRKNLEALRSFDTVAAAIKAAREGGVDTRRVQPELVTDDDGRQRVRHPYSGDLEDI
ncbi:MAG: NUDIX hydrolase [Actinobacteria bacterium]|nr:NUDIX hydrolase [Actinomycetota bacterium]